MKIGLDVGSTTVKCIVLDSMEEIVYSAYERHFSQITSKVVEMLARIRDSFPAETLFSLVISGSAGMGMAETCSIDFVQEVYATKVNQENRIKLMLSVGREALGTQASSPSVAM